MEIGIERWYDVIHVERFELSYILATSYQTKKGGATMMGFGYKGATMMGLTGFGAASIFGLISWIVVIADLILLGMWLWKQINKK